MRTASAWLLTLLWAGAVWPLPLAAQEEQDPCDPATVPSSVLVLEASGLPDAYAWQGEFQETLVCYPSRQSDARLKAYLVAPKDIDARSDGSMPVVVIGPGSGGSVRAVNYLWSARELASQGYLALVGDPQGIGNSENTGECGAEGCPGVLYQQTSNFVDGLLSATDYVFFNNHPWMQKADLRRVGMAGHSLSARAASYIGGSDRRIQAVVAWDNLSSDLYGDAGISSGGGTCGSVIGGEPPNSLPVNPRIPSMGQASDVVGGCSPNNRHPEVKKTAYNYWRAAGTASMQLVFLDAIHDDFAQTSASDPEQLRQFQYYTRAWFDTYLRGDSTAPVRLMADEVLGQSRSSLLSADFRSAYFLPEEAKECADMLQGDCESVQEPGPTDAPEPVTGRNGGALSGAVLLALLGLRFCRRSRLRAVG